MHALHIAEIKIFVDVSLFGLHVYILYIIPTGPTLYFYIHVSVVLVNYSKAYFILVFKTKTKLIVKNFC